MRRRAAARRGAGRLNTGPAHPRTLRAGVGDVHNEIGSANVASPVIEARSGVGDVTITTR